MPDIHELERRARAKDHSWKLANSTLSLSTNLDALDIVGDYILENLIDDITPFALLFKQAYERDISTQKNIDLAFEKLDQLHQAGLVDDQDREHARNLLKQQQDALVAVRGERRTIRRAAAKEKREIISGFDIPPGLRPAEVAKVVQELNAMGIAIDKPLGSSDFQTILNSLKISFMDSTLKGADTYEAVWAALEEQGISGPREYKHAITQAEEEQESFFASPEALEGAFESWAAGDRSGDVRKIISTQWQHIEALAGEGNEAAIAIMSDLRPEFEEKKEQIAELKRLEAVKARMAEQHRSEEHAARAMRDAAFDQARVIADLVSDSVSRQVRMLQDRMVHMEQNMLTKTDIQEMLKKIKPAAAPMPRQGPVKTEPDIYITESPKISMTKISGLSPCIMFGTKRVRYNPATGRREEMEECDNYIRRWTDQVRNTFASLTSKERVGGRTYTIYPFPNAGRGTWWNTCPDCRKAGWPFPSFEEFPTLCHFVYWAVEKTGYIANLKDYGIPETFIQECLDSVRAEYMLGPEAAKYIKMGKKPDEEEGEGMATL